MSCISNPIIMTKDGETHFVETQEQMMALIEEYMGPDVVERIHDIGYDMEGEQIESDLDSYEAELEDYHNLCQDIIEDIEGILSKQRIDKQKLQKIAERLTLYL